MEFSRQIHLGSAGPALLLFRLQPSVGLGAHQKIVVIDGALAFVGGLDLTIRRWDTSAHDAHHPLRADPDGKPYPPFHDVQCMVDGKAAASLTEGGEQVARRRLHGRKAAAVERALAGLGAGAIRGMTAGIARTEIATASEAGVNEVARLFEASINAADRFIYIENQFTSATDIAPAGAADARRATASRLIVTPKMHSSWFRSQAMQSGRGGFIAQFVAASVMMAGSLSLSIDAGWDQAAAVMVHSKVMIVDDRILRSFGQPQQPLDGARTPNAISPSRRRRRRTGNISPGFAAN